MISLQVVALRLVVALLLGALVGVERESREHSAGLKTLALVSLGASLMTVVSAYGFLGVLSYSPNIRLDPSHLAAQIVSGIGFLGAGAILLRRQFVRGLTTAASVWLIAGVGIACGAGLLAEAVLATVLTLLLLTLIRPIERRFFPRQTTHRLRVRLESAAVVSSMTRELVAACEREGIALVSIETRAERDGGIVQVQVRAPSRERLLKVVVALQQLAAVRSVHADLPAGAGKAKNGASMPGDASAEDMEEAAAAETPDVDEPE